MEGLGIEKRTGLVDWTGLQALAFMDIKDRQLLSRLAWELRGLLVKHVSETHGFEVTARLCRQCDWHAGCIVLSVTDSVSGMLTWHRYAIINGGESNELGKLQFAPRGGGRSWDQMIPCITFLVALADTAWSGAPLPPARCLSRALTMTWLACQGCSAC